MGFVLIGLGAAALVIGAHAPQGLRGLLWLIGAAGLWGAYTLGLRRSGLDPVAATLMLCAPSVLCILGLATLEGARLFEGVPLREIVLFVLLQGIGVGVLGGLAYAAAIARLGAARCATLGAAAPVLTLLLAALWLQEPIGVVASAGAVAVSAGVIVANRRGREGAACSRA